MFVLSTVLWNRWRRFVLRSFRIPYKPSVYVLRSFRIPYKISDPNNSKKVFQDVKPDKIMNYFINNTLKVSYNFLTILKV